MDKETLKTQLCEAIDERGEQLIAVGRHLLQNPELGFKEFKGAALVAEQFTELGLDYRDELAITGLKASVEGKAAGPSVAVIGELDALLYHGHPDSDPTTGAAHLCGHNAQIVNMLGVASALVDTDAMQHLAGRVVLFAVPAEEYVEIESRKTLREAGKLEFMAGKPELIRLGEFDDVDIAMMIHSTANTPDRKFRVGGSSNGFLAKTITFKGRASHAGAAPQYGINALNAAALAIMGINAQRETFADDDYIRVHHILTKGGDVVNVVPDDVRMELFVRGKTLESIVQTGAKVNRAIQGGAAMVGAEVEIEDLPGYLPLFQNETMNDAFLENAATLIGGDNATKSTRHVAASTDMGDVSQLLPAIHPVTGGFDGINHSADFRITDEEMAYLMPAKAMAMTVVDLLYDDAGMAQQVVADFKPPLTKEQYLHYMRTGELAS